MIAHIKKFATPRSPSQGIYNALLQYKRIYNQQPTLPHDFIVWEIK